MARNHGVALSARITGSMACFQQLPFGSHFAKHYPVWDQTREQSSYQPLEAYRKFSTSIKSLFPPVLTVASIVFPSGETVRP